MKTLILYYSYGGNTRAIAEKMQKALGCDIAAIETLTPYPADYDAVVEQGQNEINRGYEPPIRPLAHDPAGYDAILLGTPVWWYTFAPAVKTALSAIGWAGKTVYPFATNGGWIGHTFADIKKLCGGAEVKKGLNIQFDEHTLHTAEAAIDRWIAQVRQESI